MKKELIICIFIIVLIIVTNIITQNYTKNSVNKMSETLDVVSQIVCDNISNKTNTESSSIDKNKIKEEVDNLENTWNELQEKLAYYIEHDELEKVETQIYAIKGFYEIEKYDEIVPEVEKCSFILKHIEEKTKLSIKNIF